MYDTLVKYLKLRYRLMPYIYSLAGAVAHNSYTMFRALAFDFREDARTHNIDDQFMFGPAFLVAPVTTAMYYGPDSRELHGISKSRSVYLPTGDWYDYWRDKRMEGGKMIAAKADLETMPIFVRAGSIVPSGPDIQYADEQSQAVIHLKVYPGADGVFRLYEDEGDNYNYEKGSCSMIEMRWSDAGRTLILDKRAGSYEGMQANRQFTVEIVGEASHRIISYHGDPIFVLLDETALHDHNPME